MIRKSLIEEIKPIGEDGFFKSVLEIKEHGGAVEVIGENLTECVRRSVIILDAFDAIKGKA